MIRGLYSGAAAMDVLAKQQETISSNLAHLNTAGHRKFQLGVRQNQDVQNSDSLMSGFGPIVESRQVDFSQGPLRNTDRPLDAALAGDGFFSLQGNTGELYTRDGRFYRNPEDGTLVNDDGVPVLGEGGTISIPADVGDSEIGISSTGTISARGAEIGQLKITAFKDNSRLQPVSDSVFMAGDNAETIDSEVRVEQFHQEFSNAHPVTELIALIMGSRQYEAVQKATSALSESLREHIRA